MSVNPVSGSAAAQQNEQVTSLQQNQNAPKQQSTIPQDTVNISSAAKAMQTSSSGDVDHDGDSK
jgi:hypothetical protein